MPEHIRRPRDGVDAALTSGLFEGDGHHRRPRTAQGDLSQRQRLPNTHLMSSPASAPAQDSGQRRADRVCWDCAAAESFFATLKNEMYYRHRFDTRARARFAVAEYIEIFYNRRRLHSRHGYRTRPKPSAITRPEQQPDHDNHEELSTILDTAHTAWIWHFRFDRSPTSFARWRTQPRSSRVAGGAIQASGSRPIHSKSARSAASRSSFFTRCNANIFTPGGLA